MSKQHAEGDGWSATDVALPVLRQEKRDRRPRSPSAISARRELAVVTRQSRIWLGERWPGPTAGMCWYASVQQTCMGILAVSFPRQGEYNGSRGVETHGIGRYPNLLKPALKGPNCHDNPMQNTITGPTHHPNQFLPFTVGCALRLAYGY